MRNLAIAAVVAVLMAACWSPGRQAEQEIFRVAELSSDSTVYGICYAMRDSGTMVFINDMGDTMLLRLRDAVVCGYPEPECQLALILAPNGSLAKLVNITHLMGTWVEADPIDEGRETGISLLEGGSASSVNSRVHCYTNWRFWNGLLLMTSQNDMGGVMGDDIVDTFDIIKLSEDSLVMKGSGYDFHYSHPRDSVFDNSLLPPDSMNYMEFLGIDEM